MKYLSSKKIVMRGGSLRLIAILCCAIGIITMSNWKTEPNLAVFTVQIPPKLPDPGTILETRDLSNYELGRSFSTCIGVKIKQYKQCEKAMDEGRNFIFNHLKNKKRGYIIHEWSGVDTMGEFHVFVEPDENENWKAVIRWIPPRVIFSWNDYYEIKTEKAFTIKRKRITESDDRRREGKFYLSFLDKEGEEVFTL